ncbi:hypothetical protein [Actinomycetospora flava]|uniref:Uncharacterized protein n=1 Tax=Actinomycetospora flava TaxID=3129232 RepID=A0ABU8M894_9PSEU
MEVDHEVVRAGAEELVENTVEPFDQVSVVGAVDRQVCCVTTDPHRHDSGRAVHRTSLR